MIRCFTRMSSCVGGFPKSFSNLRKSVLVFLYILRTSQEKNIVKKLKHPSGGVKNCAKLTAKHLRRSPFLITLQVFSLRPATSSRKRLQYRYFPVSFAKFLLRHVCYRTPLQTVSVLANNGTEN